MAAILQIKEAGLTTTYYKIKFITSRSCSIILSNYFTLNVL